MAFVDLSFPKDVAAGVSGGPEGRTDIVPLASGAEERNRRWQNFRRQYNAGLGIRTADQLALVLDLFKEVGGQFMSFRFRDWSDYKSCLPSETPGATDQPIGTGDGSTLTYQLSKTYGSLVPHTRDITKPAANTVLVAVDGVQQSGAAFSVNTSTGLITFNSAPANGLAITAGYEFDVPVRFNTPVLNISMAFFSETEDRGLGSLPPIPLIEVIGE